jgi:serine/threonine-protein kinase
VLYRCLCGETPFETATLGELILAICTQRPKPIQDRAPWVPPAVAAIVHKALRSDPDDRFQSATEMLDAIVAELPDGWELHEQMLQAIADEARSRPAPRMAVEPLTARAKPRTELDEREADSTRLAGAVVPTDTTSDFGLDGTRPEPGRARSRVSSPIVLVGAVLLSTAGGAAAWALLGRPEAPQQTDAAVAAAMSEASSTQAAVAPSATPAASAPAPATEAAVQVGPKGVRGKTPIARPTTKTSPTATVAATATAPSTTPKPPPTPTRTTGVGAVDSFD